ncbi:FxsA family protein [Parasulfuritortus cantonensis]|uniref:FxsA family protein n=1 Tax=Parasulfuritortus cantonensis TaxID=2528202 RepID=A0A4R1BIJ1_9PROT|nr:FxsA family protein [Parasulfuritortus cantonensis]TCJ17100.1 FxsA family protein [Parasulfuritortus cantonensis]
MNNSLARFWPIIALAFPVLEIIGIVRIWDAVGIWTLVWLLLDVAAGAALIALERAAFMPVMAATMMGGGNPFEALKASGLRFLAGVMLIFPGPISDAIALILLVWAGFRPPVPEPIRRPRGAAANDDVIEGDFRRVDD